MKNLIKVCEEEKLSPNCIYYLYQLSQGGPDLLTNKEHSDAFNLLFVNIFVNQANELTDKGKRFCIDNLGDKMFDITEPEDEIEGFIDNFRKLFRGYKPSSMGDKKACTKKMAKFYKEYPEYASKEIVLKATKRYIDTLDNYQYLKQADYFIYKQDGSKIDKSLLAVYCEEVVDNIGEEKTTFTEMI